jgi:hypothetical protein
MKKAKPGAQGLANLGTWRLPFSEDVKRRRRQKLENRRPHRLRGAAPSSILGTPDVNWTEPPRPRRRSGIVDAYAPKGRGALPQHETVFLARKVRRTRHNSLRKAKNRAV